MQPPPLSSSNSPPAASDDGSGPGRRRRRLRPLHGMGPAAALIGLVAAFGRSPSSPSSSWIGGGVIIGADAAVPIAGMAAGRGAFSGSFRPAFVGGSAAGRADGRRSAGGAAKIRSEGFGLGSGLLGKGATTTVCWDTEGGEPGQGGRRRFAPFKVRVVCQLSWIGHTPHIQIDPHCRTRLTNYLSYKT